MPGKYNPFRPDKMCPPGIFAGRIDEIRMLEHCLFQTKNGNPQHFLIEGERGIGKSSIFFCEHLVSIGKFPVLGEETYLNFLTLNISLNDKDDHYSIIKKIAKELRSELQKKDKVKAFVLNAWDFISKFEAAGVRYNKSASPTDESDLLGHLQGDLVGLISTIGDEIDGVLLLIDEADKPPTDAGLGLLCKLLTEELTRRGCDRLCIGLAGLPNLVEVLRTSHESSPRIFKVVNLKPLEDSERSKLLIRD